MRCPLTHHLQCPRPRALPCPHPVSLCPPRPCPHGPTEDPSAVPVWVLGCRPSHSGVPPAPPSPGAPPGHPRFWGQRPHPPPAGGSRGAGSAQESTGGAGAWAGLVLFTEKQLGEGLVAGRSHCHLQFFITGVLGGGDKTLPRASPAPLSPGPVLGAGSGDAEPTPGPPKQDGPWAPVGSPWGWVPRQEPGGCSSPGHPLLRKRCSVPALQRCHPKANAGSQG